MNKVIISNFAASLFALLNPLGLVPIFISYTARENLVVKRWLALFVSLTALVLLMIFLFTGSSLLTFFGISIDSFRIAGGMILFVIGLGIINGNHKKSSQNMVSEEQNSDFREAQLVYSKIVIPLAMPLLVGPGSIANVILYASEAKADNNNTLFVGLMATIVVICFLIFVILLAGRWLQKLLGDVGLNILSRILGLLVASMGIQFVITGLSNTILNSIAPQILKIR
ncbi:multiple antibiotic resistance (MarC)-related protein [Rippkaea orientalis PCC 8801]|uniref:UPF0056 inner membrane protein n=1 Tax=Rippkaea orientalis (strain PCC 8801 / RF-1) TaxID=41431 RepID=B7JYX1_RIPO1|nr:MarC family protein [Rippkaea orientalis]ACK66048.1 multiple antibiotic resistance (MarC)-related protein [Rippkaea orientalis PCC 8801]